MTWDKDSDGDLFLVGDGVDACVCPHAKPIKASWDFGRWHKFFDDVESAKSFIEQWWTKHPNGVSVKAHKTTLTLRWEE